MASSTCRICLLLLILFAYGCSDEAREDKLVDLFTTAHLDLTAIEFPLDAETVVSAGSTVAFSINGIKTNGSEMVRITNDAEWSISEGSLSNIDRHGRLRAGPEAEIVTITARVGILETAIDVRVSTAVFDQVVQLDSSEFTINMCQARVLHPVGSYIDDEGEEEIRSVDNLIIGTISWEVVNAEDNTASQRAYIDTSDTLPKLHALAAGDLLIRATAPSVDQGINVTSIDLSQTVSNNLNSIKLCSENTSNLTSCALTDRSVEIGQTIKLIAVGEYQDSDNSVSRENISRRVKWSGSRSDAADLLLASDYASLQIKGLVANTSTTLTAACGNVENSLSGIDLSEGMILSDAVNCGSNQDCEITSATIDIDELSVDSLEVTVNDVEVSSNSTLALDSRPEQVVIEVVAVFSDNSTLNITENDVLVYEILPITDQADVIEAISNSPGVYDVVGAGIARVQLDYGGITFIVRFEVP